MKHLVLVLIILLSSGCASWQRPYSVDDLSEWDKKYEASARQQVYGQWLTDDTLEVVLYYPLEDQNMIRAKTMSAAVSGDLITVQFDVEPDPDYVDPHADMVALCMGEKKLTFIVHGVARKDYQVKVVSIQAGEAGAWDPEPLPIRK